MKNDKKWVAALDYDFPASYLVTLSARMCRLCSYASFVHIILLHTDDTLYTSMVLLSTISMSCSHMLSLNCYS